MKDLKKSEIKKKKQEYKELPQKNGNDKIHGGEVFIKKAVLIKQLAPDKDLNDFSSVLSSQDKASVKCSWY